MALKFKVGDVLRVKYQPNTKMFVLETLQQTCYADCAQNWYVGRLFGAGKFGIIGKEVVRLSENELEKDPPMNKKVIELVKEFKKVRIEKERLIKSQHFEKAKEYSDREKSIRNEIDIIAIDEGIDVSLIEEMKR
jgi:hypothetical protein